MDVNQPTVHSLAVSGFGRAADTYERTRPGYAPEAIRWLAEHCGLGAGRTVVDVGAGTGKLTRLLVETGARVTAVEPVAAMREKLASAVPGAELLDGVAENLPLTERCADVLTVAQAFHWFDEEAVREFARVLRPGGWVVIIWNVRDLDDPLQAALHEINVRHRPEGRADERWGKIIDSRPAGEGRDQAPHGIAESADFKDLEEQRFHHIHRLQRDDLVPRTASISFVAAAPETTRERILGEVRDLAEDLPIQIELPFTTTVYVARRTAPTP